jgi:uncharacterized protein with ParB-like and HNH nuclease domain
MAFQRPKPLMFAQSMAFGIDHLFYHWEKERSTSQEAWYNPLHRPMLCGFVIPEFQRDLVWNRDQKRALIESIWRGIPIGSYSVNFSVCKTLPPALTNIVIDGQQRLETLRSYWSNEFDYKGHYWQDLSELDQRYFIRGQFPQQRTDSEIEAEVRDYYNALNFGGTAHKQNERA